MFMFMFYWTVKLHTVMNKRPSVAYFISQKTKHFLLFSSQAQRLPYFGPQYTKGGSPTWLCFNVDMSLAPSLCIISRHVLSLPWRLNGPNIVLHTIGGALLCCILTAWEQQLASPLTLLLRLRSSSHSGASHQGTRRSPLCPHGQFSPASQSDALTGNPHSPGFLQLLPPPASVARTLLEVKLGCVVVLLAMLSPQLCIFIYIQHLLISTLVWCNLLTSLQSHSKILYLIRITVCQFQHMTLGACCELNKVRMTTSTQRETPKINLPVKALFLFIKCSWLCFVRLATVGLFFFLVPPF